MGQLADPHGDSLRLEGARFKRAAASFRTGGRGTVGGRMRQPPCSDTRRSCGAPGWVATERPTVRPEPVMAGDNTSTDVRPTAPLLERAARRIDAYQQRHAVVGFPL